MYKQIIPAEGWHFVANDLSNGKPIVFPIAAWGLQEEGSVIGLVGNVSGGGHMEPNSNRILKLIAAPPIQGMYKHTSTMTADELAAV